MIINLSLSLIKKFNKTNKKLKYKSTNYKSSAFNNYTNNEKKIVTNWHVKLLLIKNTTNINKLTINKKKYVKTLNTISPPPSLYNKYKSQLISI